MKQMNSRWKRLIGTRDFYRYTMSVAVPIMIQNGITNFVSMLDNIMVGKVGTDSMSGVAIVNQLMFVFSLCIFGGLAGIGIFTSQFYGSDDQEGIRHTVRLQVILALILTAMGVLVLHFSGENLISLYLHNDNGIGDATLTMRYAKEYMRIMFVGMLPFAMGQVYSMTLRSTGETVIPMYAGVAAVCVNLAGNYILIYGKFGAPAMGAAGAAAATVISRFTEMFLVAGWTHLHTGKYPFIVGVYRRLFDIPMTRVRTITIKAAPLLLNEALWSAGMAMLNQCYSIRGLSVVAATNISSTLTNVFNVSFIAMGSAIAIILGQKLGAGDLEGARDYAGKLTFFSVLICIGTGAVMLGVSFVFPRIYNTSPEIRRMATGLIAVCSVFMPMQAYLNACYFVIRSGGRTFITFLFDSCFVWICSVPTAFILAYYTSLPILPLFACVQAVEVIKCVIGWKMVSGGSWARNLTENI